MIESMHRRPVINGCEMDELVDHRFFAYRPGVRAQAKARYNRRLRRTSRQALGNIRH